MGDAAIINLDDAPITIEKRGCGRPRGSKNKSKIIAATSSSTTPTKRRLGRTLGRKNKKSPVAVAGVVVLLDVSLAHHIVPQASAENMFYFFAFASNQCHEHQCLPLKFGEFMDGRELREAILQEVSSDGPLYELEVYYDGKGDVFFKGGWSCFVGDYDLH
jgi:hypothetical protein